MLDPVLSMGLRSAAQICQRVTSAIASMFAGMGYSLVNYLDETPEMAEVAFIALGRLLQACGFQESVKKVCAPSTSMVFLGVLCDSEIMTLSVPQSRVSDTRCLLEDWSNKENA